MIKEGIEFFQNLNIQSNMPTVFRVLLPLWRCDSCHGIHHAEC